MTATFPGEFEQMVLLAILRLDDGAFALSVIRELDRQAGRQGSFRRARRDEGAVIEAASRGV